MVNRSTGNNPTAPPALIEMQAITKRFGTLVANDKVDLEIRPGRVHALLGENGAGKSTLMKVLSGLYRPDSGTITMEGRPVSFINPAQAIGRGIAMVHQEFMLVPALTVAENIVLGAEPRRGPWLDRQGAATAVAALCQRFGLDVDPGARVADLPVGMRQQVEILKALYRQSQVLILDEPTAALGSEQAAGLLAMVRRLADQGAAIVLITHKLADVMAVADWITVMRRGKAVAETAPARTTPQVLAEWMVGGTVPAPPTPAPFCPGPVLFQINGLNTRNRAGGPAVDNLSLEVRAGEILGVAGVQGSGQSELAEALTGLRPFAGGTLALAGRPLPAGRPGAFIKAGGGHVPEDRGRPLFTAACSICAATGPRCCSSHWILTNCWPSATASP